MSAFNKSMGRICCSAPRNSFDNFTATPRTFRKFAAKLFSWPHPALAATLASQIQVQGSTLAPTLSADSESNSEKQQIWRAAGGLANADRRSMCGGRAGGRPGRSAGGRRQASGGALQGRRAGGWVRARAARGGRGRRAGGEARGFGPLVTRLERFPATFKSTEEECPMEESHPLR